MAVHGDIKGYKVGAINKAEIDKEQSSKENKIWLIQFDASAKFIQLKKNESSGDLDFDFLPGFGGTDYHSAFELVKKVMDFSTAPKNKIIFISDGAPTLLQYKGVDTKIAVLDAFANGVLDALSTIVGGWLEVAKTGIQSYEARLSLVGMAEGYIKIINSIRRNWLLRLGVKGLLGQYADSILEVICDNSWVYFPTDLSKILVWNGINTTVQPVKTENTEVCGIYFDTTGTPTPAYGIEWISSNYEGDIKINDKYFTHVKNGNYEELLNVASGYIRNYEKDSSIKYTNQGKITVDSEYKIIDVKINGESNINNVTGNTIEFNDFDPNANIEVIVKEK